jgi:hypothetical protein
VTSFGGWRSPAPPARCSSRFAICLSGFADGRGRQEPVRQPAAGCRRRAPKAAEETSGGLSLPNPPPSAFGVSDPKDTEWVKRRLTPHPLGTYTSTLNIKGPAGNNLLRTYIHCNNPAYAALQKSRDWVKAQQGWRWAEIATGHNAMVMASDGLTRMLIGVSS